MENDDAKTGSGQTQRELNSKGVSHSRTHRLWSGGLHCAAPDGPVDCAEQHQPQRPHAHQPARCESETGAFLSLSICPDRLGTSTRKTQTMTVFSQVSSSSRRSRPTLRKSARPGYGKATCGTATPMRTAETTRPLTTRPGCRWSSR